MQILQIQNKKEKTIMDNEKLLNIANAVDMGTLEKLNAVCSMTETDGILFDAAAMLAGKESLSGTELLFADSLTELMLMQQGIARDGRSSAYHMACEQPDETVRSKSDIMEYAENLRSRIASHAEAKNMFCAVTLLTSEDGMSVILTDNSTGVSEKLDAETARTEYENKCNTYLDQQALDFTEGACRKAREAQAKRDQEERLKKDREIQSFGLEIQKALTGKTPVTMQIALKESYSDKASYIIRVRSDAASSDYSVDAMYAYAQDPENFTDNPDPIDKISDMILDAFRTEGSTFKAPSAWNSFTGAVGKGRSFLSGIGNKLKG